MIAPILTAWDRMEVFPNGTHPHKWSHNGDMKRDINEHTFEVISKHLSLSI
jgi:hypothetical protein